MMFKYKLGQLVNVLDGWEQPLLCNVQIVNRRRLLRGVGIDIQYYNQYMIEGTIYEEHQLQGESHLQKVPEHIPPVYEKDVKKEQTVELPDLSQLGDQ